MQQVRCFYLRDVATVATYQPCRVAPGVVRCALDHFEMAESTPDQIGRVVRFEVRDVHYSPFGLSPWASLIWFCAPTSTSL